jgi:histidinol-phosphate/aromatic aminotransferase/cobyric acid decarboxylase-like protein
MRYVEVMGGDSIIMMARNEVLPLYISIGCIPDYSLSTTVGSVGYTVARVSIASLKASPLLASFLKACRWGLPFAHITHDTECFHGGGSSMSSLCLETHEIDADVLDAWFTPSPDVISAVSRRIDTCMRSTPPTHATELRYAISNARHVSPENLVIGAGSSDLMYRCLLYWLTPRSHVLLVDPTYGEYQHILNNVIECSVTTFPLRAANDFDIDLEALVYETQQHAYDMVILVNPNSPTGRWADLARILPYLKASKVWVDETYIDYVKDAQSVEGLAAQSTHIVVCKSMSKIYGLSGIRLGYICASPALLEPIKCRTPPWVTSRLAQAAGVAVFTPESTTYYMSKIDATHHLRTQMEEGLRELGLQCIKGCANFVMAKPPEGIHADDLVIACLEYKLHIRSFCTPEDGSWIRVAVKDHTTTKTMISIFKAALCNL